MYVSTHMLGLLQPNRQLVITTCTFCVLSRETASAYLLAVLEGSLQPAVGSHQGQGDSHQLGEEGSHLAEVGSLQPGEGKVQAEGGKDQVVVGIRLH